MTIRLDDDVKDRLEGLAEATHRSKSYLAAEAIRTYVESNEWQIGEIRAALAEADAHDFAVTRTSQRWPASGRRMRVEWLRTALRNLDEEATYIAADDPAAARLVVKRIFDAVAQLAEQPGLGRPGRVPGTRELVVSRTHYIVPYRVRGDAIQILRIFHTSRRPPQRW